MRTQTHSAPPDATGLLALVGDCYWQQDTEDRFTVVESYNAGTPMLDAAACIGRTALELNLGTLGAHPWPVLASAREHGGRIRDRIVHWLRDDGTIRYLSINAECRFDEQGQAVGWQGLAKDVTAQREGHDQLLQLQAAIGASPDMIYMIDYESLRFVYVNDIACELTGYTRDELLCVPPYELVMIERDQMKREFDEVLRDGGSTQEMRSRTRDGQISIIEVRRRAVCVEERQLIVGIVNDISQRKKAEWARDRMSRMYAALSASNEAILRATTPADLYQQVCDAAAASTYIPMAAILLADARSVTLQVQASAGVSLELIQALALSIDAGSAVGDGLAGRCFRSGSPQVTDDYHNDERTTARRDFASGAGVQSCAVVPIVKAEQVIGVMLLAARRKRTFDTASVGLLERMAANLVFALENMEHEVQRQQGEKHIEFLATHDALTGLPNRTLLNQALVMAIESAHRHGRRFALLFLDLDRFKTINDSLGHEAGDQLLQIIGERLDVCVRANDLVARIGGDEFVLLLNEIDERKDVARFARSLLTGILEPVILRGQQYRVTTSVGIALYPEHGATAADLLKHADMAMYRAKEEGKNNFQFFCADLKARSLQRMKLESHLRQALEREEFKLVYQAKISLADERIIGVEALLRWHSPELGDVTPAQFLPQAEELGLIMPIGRWVLETACAQNMAWQSQGLPALRMAVNLSPAQFADHELVAHIESVLVRTGMPADLLELEITETAVMHDIDRALTLLAQLKSLGVFISIDDFGTGYSSLAQLRKLPVDSLKIDRSFISQLCSDINDQSIAQAIITMGRNLSLNVIAEGVETAEQQEFLRSQACDDMQGYYFSRPDSEAVFAELMRSYRPVSLS